jgi:hypothetical protein
MRRHGGISDFRVVAGQGLTWVEHAGLAVAVANFTVFPGAFCWHVKGLFNQGTLPSSSLAIDLGLGLLQVTWFLSSLYLVSLYFVLFLGARQRPQPFAGGVVVGAYAAEIARKHPLTTFGVAGLG